MLGYVQYFLCRYSDSDPNLELFDYPCKHKSCKSISLPDLRVSRAKIYNHPDKIKQDTKLSHLIEVSLPKKSRSTKIDSPRPHSLVLIQEPRNKTYVRKCFYQCLMLVNAGYKI